MSLRLRLALSFAVVAVTTSLVVVLATPVVIRYGFEPVLPTPQPASVSPVPGQEGTPGQSGERGPNGPSGPLASPAGDGLPPPTSGGRSPASSGPASSPPGGSPRPTGSPGHVGPGPSASPHASARPSAAPTPLRSARPSGQPGGSNGGGTGGSNGGGAGGPNGGDAGWPNGDGAAGTGSEAALAIAVTGTRPGTSALAPAEPSPSPPPSASPDPATLAWVEVERRTSSILFVVAVLSAVVSIAVGLILAEALIRPLRRLGRAAAAIAGGDLSRRSGVGGRRDEIGDLGRSFDTMAGALEQAEASRRRFLQDAVHELGTPVTAIQTTASAILDGVYEPERRHLEAIRDEARLLGRIVDDLRTIALAEVRRLPMQSVAVDVTEAAAATADAFGAVAAGGGRRILVDAPGPMIATGDPDRIRQVLAALVDNALRHAPEGGDVRLRAGTAGGRVRVDVEDDGPGLGEQAERVFDRFFRADATPDDHAGHAGLGLAIVRALVEAQGGRVSARNRPEGGAAFSVELPAAPGATGAVSGRLDLPRGPASMPRSAP